MLPSVHNNFLNLMAMPVTLIERLDSTGYNSRFDKLRARSDDRQDLHVRGLFIQYDS
jgi:hypothetical protein